MFLVYLEICAHQVSEEWLVRKTLSGEIRGSADPAALMFPVYISLWQITAAVCRVPRNALMWHMTRAKWRSVCQQRPHFMHNTGRGRPHCCLFVKSGVKEGWRSSVVRPPSSSSKHTNGKLDLLFNLSCFAALITELLEKSDEDTHNFKAISISFLNDCNRFTAATRETLQVQTDSPQNKTRRGCERQRSTSSPQLRSALFG